MVKKISFFLLGTLFVLLVISACTPIYCSTPDILHKGKCCPDKDKDGKCDEGKMIEEKTYVPETKQKIKIEEKTPQKPKPKTKDGVIRKVLPTDDPFIGNPEAETLFIEFADYTNTNTQRFHKEILPKLLENYGDYIKYTFRNYPSQTNKQSLQAAEASECAKEQNKFWDYHELLIENPYSLTESALHDYAKQAKLDKEQFAVCLSQQRYKEEILENRKEGLRSGVIITPTFFLDNQRIAGFKTYTTFEKVFEEVLYEQLKQIRGTKLSAKSIGKTYLILEGEAALDPTVTISPYSNKIDFLDATFTFTAEDLTKEDSATSQDKATLEVTYTLKRPQQFTKDTYRIVLKELITEGVDHTFYGGIGTNVLINGNTNIGTPYLPSSTAYVTLWGKSDLYKNDILLAEDTFTHFMITPNIRDENHKLLKRSKSTGVQAYLLLSGKYGGEHLQGTEQGFIYLYWNKLDFRQ